MLFNPQQLPFSLPDYPAYSWVYDNELAAYLIRLPLGGELFYKENFFEATTCQFFMDYFTANTTLSAAWTDWQQAIQNIGCQNINWKNIAWQQDEIKLFGKKISVPRLSAWYGDAHATYTYSGLTLQPKIWNEVLLHIKQQVEQVSQTTFNSVLMNWYRNGQDSMSWHADDERELGLNPVIASVNFGATRRFLMRNKADTTQKITIPLKNGTLLVMKGTTQHHWHHAVPKEPKIQKSRFNLTFRYILS
jgi:alkylated DNA repair dioxygenase AlkB